MPNFKFIYIFLSIYSIFGVFFFFPFNLFRWVHNTGHWLLFIWGYNAGITGSLYIKSVFINDPVRRVLNGNLHLVPFYKFFLEFIDSFLWATDVLNQHFCLNVLHLEVNSISLCFWIWIFLIEKYQEPSFNFDIEAFYGDFIVFSVLSLFFLH